MTIVISSTKRILSIDGVPVRLWEGITDNGTRCLVMVHRVAVAENEDQTGFARELRAMDEPRDVRETPRNGGGPGGA